MAVTHLLLSKPRGFCAGVDRASDVVNLALELYPGPVYVRKEIVHNVHVVNELRKKGAIFVDELDEVPDGAALFRSADSEKRMPLFAMIPTGIPSSLANPVTMVVPYNFLNSSNSEPSTRRAMISRTSY